MDKEELLERVVKRIYEQRRGSVNYVKLKGLIRRFMELNPDGDVEEIDWLSIYDDTLEYDELIKTFKEHYPQYRWEEETFIEEKEFEDGLINYVLQQVEELSEESLIKLVKALEERIGIGERREEPVQEVVRVEEPRITTQQSQTAQQMVAKPKVVVNLSLLAKYPFLDEAREFAKAFTFNNISKNIIDRAGERVLEALERGELGVTARLDNPYVELLSFPTAKAIVHYIADDWLKRRWCLAEASRIERLLHGEPEEVFDYILKRLDIRVEKDDTDYRIDFKDYLRLAGELLRDPSWKLVNQTLFKGWVYLTKTRLLRIIRQYLRQSFYESFEKAPSSTKVPQALAGKIAEVVEKLRETRAKQQPSVKLSSRGTPPCILAIQQRLAEATHAENFIYAAYLLNKGYTIEQVLEEFKVRTDYNEKIARYQIEHIAGLKGSRIKYKPPSCSKMKTLGLCVENGQKCPKNIKNPLEY